MTLLLGRRFMVQYLSTAGDQPETGPPEKGIQLAKDKEKMLWDF
jgi:hypothetical protein